MRLKYRIITNDDNREPYTVQQKGRFFWHTKVTLDTTDKCELWIKKAMKIALRHKPGTVIREYTEEDLVIDKLKGNE